MKMKRTAIPLALVFSAILTMVVFKSIALADSKHITFSEPVTIGSIVLKADTYEVVWIGSGSEVQVSFIKGNKTMATAQATLVLEKNRFNQRAVETTMLDNSNLLKRISFRDKSLVFELSNLS